MSTVTETWPTYHPSVSISGDQTWTSFNSGGGLNPGLWVEVIGQVTTTGDGVVNGWEAARCETAVATVDHEVSVLIGPLSSEGLQQRMGPAVRFDASAMTCYAAVWSPTDSAVLFWKFSAGSLTQIGSQSASFAANDTLKLRVTGSSTVSLTAFKNGTQVDAPVTDSSSPITTGTRGGITISVNRFIEQETGLHGTWTATDVGASGTNYTVAVDTMTVNVVLDAVTITYTPAGGTGAYVFGTANTDKITATVTGATTWTLAARFALAASDASTRVVAAVTDVTTTNTALILFQTSTQHVKLRFDYNSGANSRVVEWDTGFAATDIHTLVGTYNGSTLALYADTDATPKASNPYSDTPDVTTTLAMGNAGAGSLSLAGTLYEVGWWEGTALSAAQAAALGAGGQMAYGFPAPTHYYPFDGNADDLVGGANGTVTGATLGADGATNWFPTSSTGDTRVQTMGRGAWRGTWRGSFAGR